MVVKKAKNLTDAERRSCYSMSYKYNGDLLPWLIESKYNGGMDDVILAKEDGVIIGWAMRKSSGETGYWVRKSHRRKGIGTALVKRAQKIGQIKTHPHSYDSAKLFLKTNAFNSRSQRDTAEDLIQRFESGTISRNGWWFMS